MVAPAPMAVRPSTATMSRVPSAVTPTAVRGWVEAWKLLSSEGSMLATPSLTRLG